MKSKGLVRVVSVLVLGSAALTAQVARQGGVVPLRNWATPLYWQPSQSETRASGKAQPQLQFSANQVSADALTFIAITPCRLVDTRGPSAGFIGTTPFDGPSVLSGGTITIPVQGTSESNTTAPAPCGTIPSIAGAYSLNITVVPRSGGAVDYISLWPANGTQPFVSTLDDPQGAIVSNAAIVPAGTPSGGISVFNAGPSTADFIIDMNGFFAAPTDTLGNTAVGTGALAGNPNGFGNSAVGNGALADNSGGDFNTASGSGALNSNISGSSNTASGASALFSNTTGGSNTAMGLSALRSNTTGSSNIAIGASAASAVSGGGSNNIDIGSQGVSGDGAAADSGVIRIGTVGTQTSAFIAGISGATPGTPNLLVCVDGNGQLGTTGCSSMPSSRRFKQRITDMGDSSSKLFRLRPVTFFYKPEYDDGSHALQYGLIAEEVAKIYPDMVGYDKDGQPASVKYQALAPMLLNEAQKQNARVEKLEEQNRKLEDRLAALEAALAGQTATAAKPAGNQ